MTRLKYVHDQRVCNICNLPYDPLLRLRYIKRKTTTCLLMCVSCRLPLKIPHNTRTFFIKQNYLPYERFNELFKERLADGKCKYCKKSMDSGRRKTNNFYCSRPCRWKHLYWFRRTIGYSPRCAAWAHNRCKSSVCKCRDCVHFIIKEEPFLLIKTRWHRPFFSS